jgi:hypothetical protein
MSKDCLMIVAAGAERRNRNAGVKAQLDWNFDARDLPSCAR